LKNATYYIQQKIWNSHGNLSSFFVKCARIIAIIDYKGNVILAKEIAIQIADMIGNDYDSVTKLTL
jgi:hypothetical protein